MRPSTSDAAESAAESPSPWIQQSLAALAEAILAPLEARLAELGPDDRLILSTAGALSRVPLAGLPFRGAPLGALVTLSQIQGVGILEACLARPARAYESALCLGEPQRPELKPLPGALAVAQAIHDLFTALGKPAKLLTGAQATPQALAANAARFEVVHIACHALASGGPGDMASLMLTPDPQAQESGNLVEDRIIGELSLLPGCFVNLAGCSTGTQTESTAPLLGGLIPAFLVAGASSVLGSLWPIRDRAAARFQTEFYNRLVEGKPPAASLAQVQRQCLAGELGVEMQALENWAGFVVFGAG